ncbi:unnamed protein product [Ceutorhynchus assimilis]|uniref:Uncharacterized protein n=1 Tax=Ceutorhynchus assimilis TaxID=467358 RepID=A0A9N9MFL8_9CUCU|nr:unnamed protein product [Ceutorhynchus assimilis]
MRRRVVGDRFTINGPQQKRSSNFKNDLNNTYFMGVLANIPIFDELKPLTGNLEFVLYNFHDYFDGIIGIRDLRNLKLNIDTYNKILFNKTIEIPLHYRNEFNIQKIEIPPFTSVLKQIKTNLPNCEIIIPDFQSNDSLKIPSSLLKVHNGLTTIEISNPTNETQLALIDENFLKPFAQNYNTSQFECFNIEEITPSLPLGETNFDFSTIRTDHMNREEKFE